MARILLIEDEDNIRKIIAYDLKKADFDIVECGDGRTAVDLAMKEDFDVLIIDWMLPHVSGIDIVKKLRSEHIDAIFIMLTARDDETDILYAFERMMTLTKKEFDLLEYFIQNKDIVLSRDSILNDIWGFDYDGDTRIVDVHVFKLRNKLNASHVHIRSSRGVGYLLEEVHETQ